MITEKQLKVIRIIFVMLWQSIFSVCVLVGWFMTLNRLLNASDTFNAIKFGSIQTFFTGSLYLAFKYWFPSGGKAPK
jgi:hypothetical protein